MIRIREDPSRGPLPLLSSLMLLALLLLASPRLLADGTRLLIGKGLGQVEFFQRGIVSGRAECVPYCAPLGAVVSIVRALVPCLMI